MVTVEESKTFDTRLVVESGTKINSSLISSEFMLSKTSEINLNDVDVLVTDFPLNLQKYIVKILEFAMQRGKPLVIFCDEIDSTAIFTIMTNRSLAKVYIVKLNSFGDDKTSEMEDIVLKCGGIPILKSSN